MKKKRNAYINGEFVISKNLDVTNLRRNDQNISDMEVIVIMIDL